MDNLIGKTLDGLYTIQELIGAGGMANVYKAVVSAPGGPVPEGTVVAVKVLRQELMHDADLVRRFKNESKAISLLNHPNIVKVYDVSVSENLQYIVMECVVQHAKAAALCAAVHRPGTEHHLPARKGIHADQGGGIHVYMKRDVPCGAAKGGGKVFCQHVFAGGLAAGQQQVFAAEDGRQRLLPHLFAVVGKGRGCHVITR